ncbi:hypothetical protein ABPG73_002400 [Tetrahymena malaccensis]
MPKNQITQFQQPDKHQGDFSDDQFKGQSDQLDVNYSKETDFEGTKLSPMNTFIQFLSSNSKKINSNQNYLTESRQKQKTVSASEQMPMIQLFSNVELNLDDQSKKEQVNIDECQQKLIKMHPQRQLENNIQKQYTLCQSLFSTDVGTSFFCFNSKKKSDLDLHGIAISIYFKQVKGLMILSFIFFLLQIPILYLYAQTANNSQMTKQNNYSSYIAHTLAGAWGYDVWTCKMGSIIDLQEQKDNLFECQSGQFDVNYLQFGLMQPSNTTNFYGCKFAQMENIYIDCNLNPKQYFQTHCQDKSFCEIDFNEMIQQSFKSECQDALPQVSIYVSMPCKNSEMEFGSIKISKKSLSIFILSVDIAVFYLFFLFIYFMKKNNQRTADQITINNCMAKNFTILIKNLPNIEQNTLVPRLWEHLQTYLDDKCQELKQEQIKIIDIKLGVRQKQIKIQQKIAQQSRYLEKLIMKFIKKYDFLSQSQQNKHISIYYLKLLQEQIVDSKSKAKSSIDLQKITQLKQNIHKLKTKNSELQQKKNKINFAWVTFETMEQKQHAFKLLSSSIIVAVYYYFYYLFYNQFYKDSSFTKNKLHFNQRVLLVEKTVASESINWQNLYYTKTNRFCRKLFSLTITFVLLAGTFLVLAILDYFQLQLTLQYPSVNCEDKNLKNIKKEDVENFTDSTNQVALVQSAVIGIKTTWLRQQCLLPSYLTVMQNFQFRGIEKAFIVYLVNMENNFFTSQGGFISQVLSSGQYFSFNPEWYRNVGIIFTVGIISKAFSVPFGKMILYIYKKFIIWIDQKCTFDSKITRCKSNKQWINIRKGPKFSIQYRYAQHLEVLFLMMTYGAGMPLLYLGVFLYFLFSFYTDKIMIFKFCRKSIPLDQQMANYFQYMLYYSLIIHRFSYINTFDNPALFYDLQDSKQTYNAVIDVFTQQSVYFVPITLGASLIIVTYFFKLLFKPLGVYKWFCRKSNSKSEKKSIIKNIKFYEFMEKVQIDKELVLIEYTLTFDQPDQQMKNKLHEKKQILNEYLNKIELNPPQLTFIGNYSYDYKLSTKHCKYFKWQKELKLNYENSCFNFEKYAFSNKKSNLDIILEGNQINQDRLVQTQINIKDANDEEISEQSQDGQTQEIKFCNFKNMKK